MEFMHYLDSYSRNPVSLSSLYIPSSIQKSTSCSRKLNSVITTFLGVVPKNYIDPYHRNIWCSEFVIYRGGHPDRLPDN